MIEVIDSQDRDRVRRKLQRISTRNVALDAALLEQVAAIVADVRTRGDEALIDYAKRFDGCALIPDALRVTTSDLKVYATGAAPEFIAALREAIGNIREFHEYEQQQSWEIVKADGVRLGQRISPIARVGLYVPGGTASYPSSVV